MSNDVASDHLALAQLAELSARLLSATETVERLANGIRNHVLFAGTVTLNSDGLWTFGWGAMCGSAEITNVSASTTLTVAPGISSVAPLQGPGVHKIQPQTFRIVNIDSSTMTIYGTAGDTVGVQAFTTGGLAGQGVAA